MKRDFLSGLLKKSFKKIPCKFIFKKQGLDCLNFLSLLFFSQIYIDLPGPVYVNWWSLVLLLVSVRAIHPSSKQNCHIQNICYLVLCTFVLKTCNRVEVPSTYFLKVGFWPTWLRRPNRWSLFSHIVSVRPSRKQNTRNAKTKHSTTLNGAGGSLNLQDL